MQLFLSKVLGPFKQIQVIMARGLASKWKQPIFMDFDKKMSKEILHSTIQHLHEIGFKVVACVSDLGGGNVGAINQLQVTKENPTFRVPGVETPITYFPDAPHLLKLLRNWIIDGGFTLKNGEQVRKEPLEKLIRLTTSTEIKACYKLTMDHLPQKGSFKRQNVRMASQLLSHTTSKSLINFHLKKKIEDEHTISTANFIETSDKWFDLVNIRFRDQGMFTPPQKKAYGDQLEEQNDILDEMATTIMEMKVNKSTSSAIQIFQKGIIQHVNATKALYQNLYPEGLRYITYSTHNIPIKLSHTLQNDQSVTFYKTDFLYLL